MPASPPIDVWIEERLAARPSSIEGHGLFAADLRRACRALGAMAI